MVDHAAGLMRGRLGRYRGYGEDPFWKNFRAPDEPNPADKVKQETDKLLRMLKEAQGLDDALVMLSSVQSVTKLVTDQGAVYAEICRLADACQLDLSSVGKKLKFPGANVKESARIALENMNVLNESALEIASKYDHDLNAKQFARRLRRDGIGKRDGIGNDASLLTAVDWLRSLDVSLAALSENIILLGTAIFAVRDAKGDPDWHEHRPAPADGNDRVLALASIMNQRRLIRNLGKAIILQEGGSAKLARTKLDRQDSLHYERVILTAKPMKTSCVLL